MADITVPKKNNLRSPGRKCINFNDYFIKEIHPVLLEKNILKYCSDIFYYVSIISKDVFIQVCVILKVKIIAPVRKLMYRVCLTPRERERERERERRI